jgi:hypothetical protein
MEPITRGPLTDMKRLHAKLDVHGIAAEILRPIDCNLGA